MDPARHGLSSSHNTHPRLAQSAHGESMAPVVSRRDMVVPGCRGSVWQAGSTLRPAGAVGRGRPAKPPSWMCVLSKSNICERPCEWELAWHVLGRLQIYHAHDTKILTVPLTVSARAGSADSPFGRPEQPYDGAPRGQPIGCRS